MSYLLILILVGCTVHPGDKAPTCDQVAVQHRVYATEAECLASLKRRGTSEIKHGGLLACVSVPAGESI